jgi:hypothetical protein
MTRELAREFNEEVERYRRALVYFARKREWSEFKRRAAGLFDYVEQVEATERERRFFRIFNSILVLLVLAVLFVIGIDPGIGPGWQRHKQTLLMACLAASGFELYFFLNFRWYAEMRKAGLLRRREQFLRNIERDFRSFPLGGGEVRT